MCGIAGFSGHFDPALLPQMAEAIASRGPDDAGQWFDGSAAIGLAHRRLSIIDLSELGHQPMWDITRRCCIVFNGEIYNYRELRQGLIDDGHRLVSETDTEVLLNLYVRHGDAMLTRLNGMFAFAIWDCKYSTLFVARDGLGVKPLYYTETAKGFLFASALHALLCDTSVSTDLDATAILDYLTLLYAPAPSTLLRHVSKLEPGTALTVKSGRVVRKWQWTELPFGGARFGGSDEQAAVSLRGHLADCHPPPDGS